MKGRNNPSLSACLYVYVSSDTMCHNIFQRGLVLIEGQISRTYEFIIISYDDVMHETSIIISSHIIWLSINWLHNGFRTRTGGREFLLLPWHWHNLSIPLKSGRGISAETCGLHDVFSPGDLGSGPATTLIVYIPYIKAAFLVIKINSF